MLSLYTLKKGLSSKIMSTYDIKKNSIFIGDISPEIEDKGYGSILMVNIIKIAKILKVDTIIGNLAEADNGHFDKLAYFYKKHSFTVEIDVSGMKGAILRKM